MKKTHFLSAIFVLIAFTLTACVSTKTTEESVEQTEEIETVEETPKTTKEKIKEPEPAPAPEPEDPPNIKFAKMLQKELEAQNIKGAISLFEQIPEELKDDIELKLLLGALYYSDSQFENAINVANEVLTVNAENMDALELISMCNHAMGDKKSYQATSKRILEVDPYNVSANIQKAQDLVLNKKYKLARDAYKKALKGDSSNEDALFGYAQTSYYIGDSKNSQAALQKLIELNPENPQANAYLGKLAAEEENYLKAAKFVQKAIDNDPTNYDYYLDLGNYLRYQGKFDQATEAWQKATELDPTYFLAYTYLAGIYDEQNRFDKALENYHMVIETNPKYYYAYEETAILEYHMGNWENAIKYFSKAYEYSDSYAYKLMCAACYIRLGDKLKVKDILAPVLKSMANDKESLEYLMVRFYYDTYNRNAESTLTSKIAKEDNSNKRGKMLFYMGLYYELAGAKELANEYYAKVTSMQAPMFFEYRIAEWSLES